MSDTIDDLRIVEITPLTKPADIMAEIHRNTAVTETVTSNRDAIHKILQGEDDRLIVVIGPCSNMTPLPPGNMPCGFRSSDSASPTTSKSSCAFISKSPGRRSAGRA